MFIMVVVFIFLIKPQLFFDRHGQIKPFGLQSGEEMTPIPLVMGLYGLMFIIYCIAVYVS